MYSLKMFNKNGHVIEKKAGSVKELMNFASHFPLCVYFAWIYNIDRDQMVYQNDYTDKWIKCNNSTFIPYH